MIICETPFFASTVRDLTFRLQATISRQSRIFENGCQLVWYSFALSVYGRVRIVLKLNTLRGIIGENSQQGRGARYNLLVAMVTSVGYCVTLTSFGWDSLRDVFQREAQTRSPTEVSYDTTS